MNSSCIMPLVAGVQRVFETMLQLQVHVGQPVLAGTGEPACDVSGIIGIAGDLEGTVVLSFPSAVAQRVVARFTGGDLAHTHPDFPDAMVELLAMVGGNAKARFQERQALFSRPCVVIGASHRLFCGRDAATILLPCGSEAGDFTLEVAIRSSSLGSAGSSVGNAAAAIG